MIHQFFILSSTVSFLLLALSKPAHAQGGGTINVCGINYKDAEDHCGVHPSCGNLQCPNQYWLEGQVLMKCFAVPMEKCDFGAPEVVTTILATPQNVPLELDPNNTNYCGVSSLHFGASAMQFSSLSLGQLQYSHLFLCTEM